MRFKNIFIVSLVLEQIIFLYFSLFSISFLGARFIQFLVLTYILFLNPSYISVNLKKIDKVTVLFIIFILLGFLTAIVNLFLGNYFVSFNQNVINESNSNEITLKIIRETLAYIYFFILFIFLFNKIIDSPFLLRKFFKYFKIVFMSSVIIGYFLYVFYIYYNYNLLPRQLNYGFASQVGVDVGLRFMGLFGEPRDAAACLLLGLGIITLEQIHLLSFNKINSFKKSYIVNFSLILIAFYLTNSGSAVIALVLFIMITFISFFFIIRPNIRTLVLMFFGALYMLVILSGSRISIYYDEILKIPQYMSGDNSDNLVLYTQFNNILPIWLFVENLINYKFISVFFGNGFGSSSYISYQHLGNYYQGSFENPHSQVSRLVFETGILGSMIWYFIFIIPLYRFKKIVNKKYFIILCIIYFLSFSGALAHRNPEMFLLLGVALCTVRQYYNQSNVLDN